MPNNPFETQKRFTPVKDPYQNPQQPAVDEEDDDLMPKFKSVPELHDETGALNPRYDTSKGRDILAGIGVGVGMGFRDPYQLLGSAIGGALGGVFAKNIAGRIQHGKDIEEVAQYNKELATQSEASRRIALLIEQKRTNMVKERIAEEKLILQQTATKHRVGKDQMKWAQDALQSVRDPETKAWLQKTVMLNLGLNPEEVDEALVQDPNMLVQVQTKKIGDQEFLVTKGGEFLYALDPNGKVVSHVTDRDKLDMLIKMQKLEGKEDSIDPALYSSAIREATNVIQDMEKQGLVRYKTPRGQVLNSQRNSHIMQIANKLVSKRNNGQTGGVIDGSINVGGTEYTFNFDMGKLTSSSSSSQQPTDDPSGNSIFMPEISGEGEDPVRDPNKPEGVTLTTSWDQWPDEDIIARYNKGKQILSDPNTTDSQRTMLVKQQLELQAEMDKRKRNREGNLVNSGWNLTHKTFEGQLGKIISLPPELDELAKSAKRGPVRVEDVTIEGMHLKKAVIMWDSVGKAFVIFAPESEIKFPKK